MKNKQIKSEDVITVRMPRALLRNLIIFEIILVSILSLIAIFSSEVPSGFYLFLFLSYMILVPTILLKLFWKRTIQGNKIHVSNIFNQKRSFTIDQIKEVRIRKYRNGVLRDATLLSINGERLLRTDPHEEGYNEFLMHLYEQNIPIISDKTNERMKP